MSCFLHPAYECKEAGILRAQLAVEKGININNTPSVEIPEQLGQGLGNAENSVNGPHGATQNLQMTEEQGELQKQPRSAGKDPALEDEAGEGDHQTEEFIVS